MCGIVGILAKDDKGFWQSDIKVFEQMLWADQLRGVDGTGVFFNNGKAIHTSKAPIPASKFITNEQWDKIVSKTTKESDFVIGHNRWATKGNLVHKDTHPFTEGSITLVHNGTLYSHKHIADVDVDSHAICHSINKEGYEKTLKRIYGAWALVWYDRSDKKIRFIRNKERPLNIIETKDLFVICSEMALGEWILSRNNIPIIAKESLPVHMLYTYDPETKKLSKEQLDLEYHYTTYNTPYEIKPAPKWYKNENLDRVKIGSFIQFYPSRVLKEGNSYYLEGVTEEANKDVEVRLYNWNASRLDLLLKNESLIGYISQTVTIPKDNKTYYVLRDVEVGYKSSNDVIITEAQYNLIAKKCSCCNVGITAKESISHCKLKLEKGVYEITCPDCSDWEDSLQQDAEISFGMGAC